MADITRKLSTAFKSSEADEPVPSVAAPSKVAVATDDEYLEERPLEEPDEIPSEIINNIIEIPYVFGYSYKGEYPRDYRFFYRPKPLREWTDGEWRDFSAAERQSVGKIIKNVEVVVMQRMVGEGREHQKTYILSGNRIIKYTYDPMEEDGESVYLQFTTPEAAEHWLHNSIDETIDDEWEVKEGIRDHAGHGPTTHSIIKRHEDREKIKNALQAVALASMRLPLRPSIEEGLDPGVLENIFKNLHEQQKKKYDERMGKTGRSRKKKKKKKKKCRTRNRTRCRTRNRSITRSRTRDRTRRRRSRRTRRKCK
jgi:hypothetical protein